MLLRLVREHLSPTRPGCWPSSACSSSARSRRSTCPASTPTSSTTASPRATPATSCAPAASMLGVTLRADRLLDRRGLLRRARTAMGFGRDLRGRDLPPGRAVLPARGAAVRRAVADHPQHQRRAAGADARADDLHDAGRARRSCASAASSWRCARTSGCPGCWPSCVPALLIVGVASSSADGAAVPRDAGAHRRRSTGCCASRSPASAWCARSCASRTRRERFAAANADLTDDRAARRPAAGADVPDRDAGAQRLAASRCCGSAAHRVESGADADRLADRVPQLPDADPDVGHDGDVHG